MPLQCKQHVWKIILCHSIVFVDQGHIYHEHFLLSFLESLHSKHSDSVFPHVCHHLSHCISPLPRQYPLIPYSSRWLSHLPYRCFVLSVVFIPIDSHLPFLWKIRFLQGTVTISFHI